MKRVQEIYLGAGMVYLLPPRVVFRVKDSRLAEKLIHDILKEYRVRDEREFFEIIFKEACKKIEKH